MSDSNWLPPVHTCSLPAVEVEPGDELDWIVEHIDRYYDRGVLVLTYACPCSLIDGSFCNGFVEAIAEWEPPDPSYGADADGNRGRYIPGYWTTYVDQQCSCGHELPKLWRDKVKLDASDRADSWQSDREGSYYEPD